MIKVTGTPVTYGDGATRNTKEGKGRFDLIPCEPFAYILNILDDAINDQLILTDVSGHQTYYLLINNNNDPYRIALAIISLIMIKEHAMSIFDVIDGNLWADTMLRLAKHFENGAKIYGERNCEKGIPKWSFLDSGLRHLCQYLNKEEDEDHYIAAIWNMWMLIWTIDKESRMHSDQSDESPKKTNGDIKHH